MKPVTKLQKEEILQHIRSIYLFFDTICIWLPRHLRKNDREKLKTLCCGGINYHALPPEHCVYFENNNRIWIPAAQVQLNQPTQEAIEFLKNYPPPDVPPRVYRVDIAAEFIVPTERHAHYLQLFFLNRMKKNWSRSDHTTRCVGRDNEFTFYIGRRADRTVWAGYATLPSKINGESCLRLEVRLTGHQTVRAQRFGEPDKLLALNAVATFRRKLRLYEIDRRKLGLALRKKHGNTKLRQRQVFLYDVNLASADLYLRNIWYQSGDFAHWDRTWGPTPRISTLSQKFRKGYRHLGKSLVELDFSSMLERAEFRWPTLPG